MYHAKSRRHLVGLNGAHATMPYLNDPHWGRMFVHPVDFALEPRGRVSNIVRIDQAHGRAPGRGRLTGSGRLTLQPTDEIAGNHGVAGPNVVSKKSAVASLIGRAIG
jgi:hypothetical protein